MCATIFFQGLQNIGLPRDGGHQLKIKPGQFFLARGKVAHAGDVVRPQGGIFGLEQSVHSISTTSTR